MGTKVSSTITLDTATLQKLDRGLIDALCMTADQTMTELKNAGVMPFDKGDMQNAQTELNTDKKGSGVVSIVTTAPQARRLYYHPEYKFTKKDNRSAGGHWFERLEALNRISDTYAKFFKMLGGI